MSRKSKIWLITATSLVLAGLIIFTAVMFAYDWDFTRLSTDRFQTNTYEISEEFSAIKINTETADILFEKSGDDTCKAVCREDENIKHSASVKNGILTVKSEDSRAWYEHIGFSFHSPKITVYLPKTDYLSLAVKESTGDIKIPKDFKFGSADISLSTGDVEFSACVSGLIKINTSTGDINVKDITADTLDLSVSTGTVNVSDVMCKKLLSNGSTGDITLKNVIAAEKFSIERSTGDVRFGKCDAGELKVNTGTGNVTGSLLSSKVFNAHSDTGYIDVPKTASGGKCKITTDTGDIHITVYKTKE